MAIIMVRILESDLKNDELESLPIRKGCSGDCYCIGTCQQIITYLSRQEFEQAVKKWGFVQTMFIIDKDLHSLNMIGSKRHRVIPRVVFTPKKRMFVKMRRFFRQLF